MSEKSKNTRATKSEAAIDRPFDADVLKRAEEIVSRYQVLVSFEDGEYYGRGLELPGVMADGRTPAACYAATREAMAFTVAAMIEDSRTPPPPALEGQRTEQVNVRLTAEEKLEIETAAQQRGFRGVADFFRTAAVAMARQQQAAPAAPTPGRR